LTDRFCAAVKVETRTDYNDEEKGLILRVTATGSKSWCARYTSPVLNKQQRATLGSFPQLSVAGARRACRELKAAVDAGRDPYLEKVAEKDRRAAAKTLAELAERWFENRIEGQKAAATATEYRRLLDVHILPALGHLKLEDISRAIVFDFLESEARRIRKSGLQGTLANRELTVFSGLFRYAVRAGQLEHSPVFGIEKIVQQQPKDRRLSDAEIAVMWPAVGEGSDVALRKGLALKLVLVTGARPGAVLAMRRQDVDLKARTWTIPVTKKARNLIVPLSRLAIDLIGEAMRLSDGEQLFNTPARNLSHTTADVCRAHKIARFSPHDLRRTCATGLSKLGTPQFMIARVLGHADPTVTGSHYIIDDFVGPKREALDAWAAHLEQLLGIKRAESVVDLHAPR
jgi:integrase